MTTTRYVVLKPRTPPQDIGLDPDSDRAMLVFQVDCEKDPSETFPEELVFLLVTAGVGVFETNIFISSRARIPEGPGPFLIVTETTGLESKEIHGSTLDSYSRPAASITVIGASYLTARAMAHAAHTALQKKNTVVSF